MFDRDERARIASRPQTRTLAAERAALPPPFDWLSPPYFAGAGAAGAGAAPPEWPRLRLLLLLELCALLLQLASSCFCISSC